MFFHEVKARQLKLRGISFTLFTVAISLFFVSFIPGVSLADETEVEKLILKGEAHFKAWEYTSPADANAFKVFTEVLKLDPDNKIALQRLQDMENYYLRKAGENKEAGDVNKAKYFYKKVLIVNKSNEEARKALKMEVIDASPPQKEEYGTEKQSEPTPEPTPELSASESLEMQRYENYPASIVALLNEGSEFQKKRNSEDQTPILAAIDKYKEVLAVDPQNYDALWRMSWAFLWLGDHSSEEKKIDIFTQGMDFGKKAIEVNPNGLDGHYWYGSNMGKYGEARGIFKSLQFIDPIIQEMETNLKIDPNHYKSITVLGIIYRKAPPWPVSVGDMDKSLEFLQRAISINDKSLHAHLNLGITYNKLKEWQKAKECFQKVIDMPMEPDWIPENLEYKEEAREILMMMRNRGL